MRVETVSQNLALGLVKESDLIAAIPEILAEKLRDGYQRLDADWMRWTQKAGAILIPDRPLTPCGDLLLSMLKNFTQETFRSGHSR